MGNNPGTSNRSLTEEDEKYRQLLKRLFVPMELLRGDYTRPSMNEREQYMRIKDRIRTVREIVSRLTPVIEEIEKLEEPPGDKSYFYKKLMNSYNKKSRMLQEKRSELAYLERRATNFEARLIRQGMAEALRAIAIFTVVASIIAYFVAV